MNRKFDAITLEIGGVPLEGRENTSSQWSVRTGSAQSSDKEGTLQPNILKKQLKDRPLLRKAPLVVLAFFVLVWGGGVATGEAQQVLEQAWQVCLSCIGIG